MPTTPLGAIITKLESGGSTNEGPLGPYSNYAYQQFPGFVSQYGSGEAGVLNYGNQVLQANPNATLGDFYGGYVTGTGNPAAANVNSLLTTSQPGAQGAYSNLINNAGVPASTPLSRSWAPMHRRSPTAPAMCRAACLGSNLLRTTVTFHRPTAILSAAAPAIISALSAPAAHRPIGETFDGTTGGTRRSTKVSTERQAPPAT